MFNIYEELLQFGSNQLVRINPGFTVDKTIKSTDTPGFSTIPGAFVAKRYLRDTNVHDNNLVRKLCMLRIYPKIVSEHLPFVFQQMPNVQCLMAVKRLLHCWFIF
jgi:hypothetical protein